MRGTLRDVAAIAGALALGACGGEGEGPVQDNGPDDQAAAPTAAAPAVDAPERLAPSGRSLEDEAEYLYHLGMMRGHLAAFIELHRVGETEMAATHAKHSDDELYAMLKPEFAARKTPGFHRELDAFGEAAASGTDVEASYVALVEAIGANAPDPNVRAKLLAVAMIVDAAADKFDAGVADDGSVIGHRDYQDAYGFLVAAREMLAEETTGDINAGEAIAVAHEQIDLAFGAFSGMAADSTEGDPSMLYGAASIIDRAARRL